MGPPPLKSRPRSRPAVSNGGSGGGSALRRLKQGMLEAGLIGRQRTKPAGAKSKSNSASTTTKGSRKLECRRAQAVTVAPRQTAALSALRSNNPFEMQTSRTKHHVLGRTIKGTQGRPAVARQAALATRRTAILGDLRRASKAGTFVDQRIGECDSGMERDTKMMLRWTNERHRQSARLAKASVFNLASGGGRVGSLSLSSSSSSVSAAGAEERFTHFGRALGGDDGGTYSDDSDSDGGAGGLASGYNVNDPDVRALLAESNFGGGSEDLGRKRSRAEIMRDVVATAKKRKAERLQLLAEDDEMRLETDAELPRLLAILSRKRDVDKSNGNDYSEEVDSDTEKLVSYKIKEDDEYDNMVNQLRYEKRAPATDRVKTEEELAFEARQKLEKFELERLRRMFGDDENDDNSGNDEGNDNEVLAVAAAQDNEDDSGGESDNDKDSGDESRSGKPPHHDVADDDFVSDSSSADSLTTTATTKKSTKIKTTSRQRGRGRGLDPGEPSNQQKYAKHEEEKEKHLPFKFEAPGSQGDFDKLMLDRQGKDVAVLMGRLRVLFHPSLAEGNKERIARAFGYLLDYVWRRQGVTDVNLYMAPVYKQILELSRIYPLEFANWASHALAGCMAQPLVPAFTGFQLAMLRCTVRLFSSSDFHHAVITPLLVCCASYLGQPKNSTRDITCGLYVVGICIESQRVSRRWVPECFNFLAAVLSRSSTGTFGDDNNSNSRNLHPSWLDSVSQVDSKRLFGRTVSGNNSGSSKNGVLRGSVHQTDEETEIDKLPADPDHMEPTNTMQIGIQRRRQQILLCAVRMVRATADLYASTLASYPETFGLLPALLRDHAAAAADISQETASSGDGRHRRNAALLRDTCNEVAAYIDERVQMVTGARQPLQMQKHRPVPMQELEPAYERNYSLDRRDDGRGGMATSEVAKLRGLVKREKRGAVRELRRDAEFLSSVRLAERKQSDAEYGAKIRRILGSFGNEVGGHKEMEREVVRAKLRKGRK